MHHCICDMAKFRSSDSDTPLLQTALYSIYDESH